MPGFFDTYGYGGFSKFSNPDDPRQLAQEASAREQMLKMRALQGAMQTSQDLEQNYGKFTTQGFSPSGFGLGSYNPGPTRPGMMDVSNDRQRTALALEALQTAFKPAVGPSSLLGIRPSSTEGGPGGFGAQTFADIPSKNKEEERKALLQRMLEDKMYWGGRL